ncbi:MAG: hypothetical protein CL868_12040 [Cytophagaceae bacterium]|nr:hypothetical protein [Cytophagaceae bacterium]|tara:strand:- start:11395 stop:11847 length:453 start_codon:yes stop_codon:yes gene_type:complete
MRVKQILTGILFAIIGSIIAFYSYDFLRNQIQEVFVWSTADSIQFIGKDFYLFASYFYYISFSISFSILVISSMHLSFLKIFKRTVLSIVIFATAMILISSVDGNLKVIECTACDNGIRKLHWNEINYGFIVGLSSIIAAVPSIISVLKR